MEYAYHYTEKEILLSFYVPSNMSENFLNFDYTDSHSHSHIRVRPEFDGLVRQTLPATFNFLFGRVIVTFDKIRHVLPCPFSFPEEHCGNPDFINNWFKKNENAMQMTYIRKHILKSLHRMSLPSSATHELLYTKIKQEEVKLLSMR